MRLRYLLRPREVINQTSLQVLSVYRDHGVVPKNSRSDNFNRTPEDITRYQEVRVGDLVVNKMKAWQGSVGISAHHGIVSPDYLVCSVDPSADSRFLHHLLRSAPLAAQFGGRSKGIRPAQWRLYWEDLAEIRVTLPPRDEQRRIADFLDVETSRIDRLQATTTEQLELLNIRRLEVLRTMTTGAAYNASQSCTHIPWIPYISSEWSLFKVGRSFLTGSGTTPHSSDHRFFDGPHSWINTGDLRDGIILNPAKTLSDVALREYPTLRIYPAGTLMVAMYGATIGRVGLSAAPACVNQACCALTPLGVVDAKYSFYWFLAHRVEIVRLGSGGGQPNISQDLVRSLKIAAPNSMTKQRAIAADCARFEEENTDHRLWLSRRAALLSERRHALITAAVTGQIDVTTARGLSPSGDAAV